jgi:putative transposase
VLKLLRAAAFPALFLLFSDVFHAKLTTPMRKLLNKHGFAPAVIMTDELRSYDAVIAELGLIARYELGLCKNNRAEVSHQAMRRRERMMQLFKSAGSAQRFLSINSASYNPFTAQRHLIFRRTLRLFRAEATARWHVAAAAD